MVATTRRAGRSLLIAIISTLATVAAAGCAQRVVRLDGKLGPPPPTPLEPAEGAVVMEPRPTLRWTLPKGEDGVLLRICAGWHCKRFIREERVLGDRWTATEDLPAGQIGYTIRGGVGEHFGLEESPRRSFAHEPRAVVAGKYVDIIAPPEQKDFVVTMAIVGDRAIEFYSSMLGVPISDIRPRVYCYVTDDGYLDATRRYGKPGRHVGFSGVWGSHVRLESQQLENMESRVLHELVHAFQNKSVLLHRDQPPWYAEGMAELLADRALTEAVGLPRPTVILNGRRASLRTLVEKGKLIHLVDLFEIDRAAARVADADVSAALYAESFLLLDLLDSPSQPARRAVFRKFMKDVANMRGFAVSWRIKSRLKAAFGDPALLEAELLASLIEPAPAAPTAPAAPATN